MPSVLTLNNTVQKTTDYDKFNLLSANREVSRAHVEAVKKSFEENGNFTSMQPILVNDDFEVIDGQHRLVACRELGIPVFFTVIEGANINHARQMNILHRQWTVDDFAESYAQEGYPQYREFLRLRAEYPQFSHSVVLAYSVDGGNRKGMWAEFRSGDLELDTRQSILQRLDMLSEAYEISEEFKSRNLAFAFLSIMKNPGYDHRRFMRKLQEKAGSFRAFVSYTDNLRALEEVYNYHYAPANHVRFF